MPQEDNQQQQQHWQHQQQPECQGGDHTPHQHAQQQPQQQHIMLQDNQHTQLDCPNCSNSSTSAPAGPSLTEASCSGDTDEFVDCEPSSQPRPYKRSVSFPSDDAIAVVHHLHPSSSAGDISIAQCEAAAADPCPPPTGCWPRFKAAVKQLKRDVLALYYAVHDPRTPLLSKLLPWMVLAYALSPLDLIPDFIPVLGFLDDMLLLPLGLWLSYKLIPAQVMEDSRERAAAEPLLLHKNWVVASLVFVMWCAGLLLLEHWLIATYGSPILQEWQWWVVGVTGWAALLVFVVWAVMRVRFERKRREVVGGALLAGYDSSDDEIV